MLKLAGENDTPEVPTWCVVAVTGAAVVVVVGGTVVVVGA
jgi:hypothetical protein